jgi:hypothetical protein
VAPGRYEAEVDAAAAGSHVLSIRYDAPGAAGSVRAAITRRDGEEFRQPTPSTAMLWELARQTKGRVYRLDAGAADLWVREHLTMPEISRPMWLLVAALAVALFLADVGVRRVALDMARLRGQIGGLFGRAPEVASTSVATLAASSIKARAASRERAAERPGTVVPMPPRTMPPTPTVANVEQQAKPKPVKPPHAKGPSTADADVMARLRAAKTRSRERDG